MRQIIAGLLLALGITAAAAQAPPPVPALPDSTRITAYTISTSTCVCAVGFQLYGDSTDYANWLQVWVNGVQIAQAGNWTISSPTGPLATIPRPITDAVLTFTATQTGTVQIVGARRPRRLSQFAENRGVAARDLNQAVTDLVAENREQWDALLRTIIAPPGDPAIPLLLPSSTTRASKLLGFDANGNPAVFTPGVGGGGNVVGPAGATNNDFACFNGTTGLVIKDCGAGVPVSIPNGGTGQTTAAAARAASGLNIDEYTAHGDSNYTILSTDRTVGTNAALTAARTWTLPAASSVNPGQTIIVADYASGVTGTNTLTIARAGSDTIIAGSSVTSVAISTAGGRYDFRSDGVSKWSASAVAGTSSGQFTSILNYAKCDGVTDDSTAIQNWLNALPTLGMGIVPVGLTCLYNNLLFVPSNAYFMAYGATLKVKNGGSLNSGIMFTDVTQGTAVGPKNAGIYGGTFDGNRVNRVAGSPNAATIYIISATNIILQDTIAINCAADCYYVGGNTTLGGVSQNVAWRNVIGSNPNRNAASVVGVSGFSIKGCSLGGAVTASPQAGLDIEPDSANTPDNDLWIDSCLFAGNTGAGVAVNPANISGGVNRGLGTNLSANSNGGCGFTQFITTANAAGFRFSGIGGAFNTGGLACSLAADKIP